MTQTHKINSTINTHSRLITITLDIVCVPIIVARSACSAFVCSPHEPICVSHVLPVNTDRHVHVYSPNVDVEHCPLLTHGLDAHSSTSDAHSGPVQPVKHVHVLRHPSFTQVPLFWHMVAPHSVCFLYVYCIYF